MPLFLAVSVRLNVHVKAALELGSRRPRVLPFCRSIPISHIDATTLNIVSNGARLSRCIMSIRLNLFQDSREFTSLDRLRY